MPPAPRRIAALLAVWAFFHLTAGSFVMEDDGAQMLLVAYRLVRGERPPVTSYGLGQSLVLAPAAAVIEPAKWPSRPEIRSRDNWRVKAVPALVSAVAVLLVHDLLRRIGHGRRAAAATAALVATGSLVWPYAESLFAEVTLGACFLAALRPLARLEGGGAPTRADQALAGGALGLGLLTKPAFAPAALAVVAATWIVEGRRRKDALSPSPTGRRDALLPPPPWAMLAPLAAATLAALAWNAWRFGDPLRFGYATGADAGLGFSARYARLGVAGLLGSPGKGLLLYVPLLAGALAFARPFAARCPALSATVLITFGAELALHGSWWAWHGDWAWGPRFLVPYATPLLLPLVHAWEARRRTLGAVLALFVASAGVQALGVFMHHAYHLKLMTDVVRFAPPAPEHPEVADDLGHSHFIPSMSPIVSHAWLLRAALARDADIAATCPWRGVGPPEWTDPAGSGLPAPPPIDLWALDPPLPGRRARIDLEAAVLLLGLYVALRGRATSGEASRA